MAGCAGKPVWEWHQGWQKCPRWIPNLGASLAGGSGCQGRRVPISRRAQGLALAPQLWLVWQRAQPSPFICVLSVCNSLTPGSLWKWDETPSVALACSWHELWLWAWSHQQQGALGDTNPTPKPASKRCLLPPERGSEMFCVVQADEPRSGSSISSIAGSCGLLRSGGWYGHKTWKRLENHSINLNQECEDQIFKWL